MRKIWWWVTGRFFAENMFFPVGWPRVLNTCEQGKINAVVCNRDKIMFAVLTADSLVIWYCKARNLSQESASPIRYRSLHGLHQYCCNVATLLQYCWNDLYCIGFSQVMVLNLPRFITVIIKSIINKTLSIYIEFIITVFFSKKHRWV